MIHQNEIVNLHVYMLMKERNYDLTEGVSLSSHGAPSSTRALLETHWFQVYTALVHALATFRLNY